MIQVIWPSNVATRAEVWRILDLSGMSRNPRDSYNFVRAGIVFLNGSQVADLRTTVEVGSTFHLEVRHGNGKVDTQYIFLVGQARQNTPRSSGTFTVNRRP